MKTFYLDEMGDFFSQNVVKVNLSFVVCCDRVADQLEMMCFCLGFHY